MDTLKIKSLLTAVLLMVGAETFAYDYCSMNDDGEYIYYNIISATECQVTFVTLNGVYNCDWYKGSLKIPLSIEYRGRTLSVTSIGEKAFNGCEYLTSVTIPNSVTSIGEDAFCYCSGLTSMAIPNSVTSIGDRAFSCCSGLTSVTIPNSVTSIGDRAFMYCSGLTSVAIPNSVTSIGESAFYRCSGLTSVTIPNSVTSIGKSAFEGCSGLTSVTIPNSVTSIGEYAFAYCNSLTCVNIPNSVTTIGSHAFNSSGLTSVEIPNSVTSIESCTFKRCVNLVSVSIPKSLDYIGGEAFEGCDELSIVRMEGETPIDLFWSSPFDYTGPMIAITLEVPKGSKSAYASTPIWCDFWDIVEYEVNAIKEVHGGTALKSRKYLDNGHVVIVNDDNQFMVDGKKF